jgi:hypothetical protein
MTQKLVAMIKERHAFTARHSRNVSRSAEQGKLFHDLDYPSVARRVEVALEFASSLAYIAAVFETNSRFVS